jgi:hypothetical protein
MPSQYLATNELSTYGVPKATSAQVTYASAIIDAHLNRPEGLVWSPDSNGSPCFMAAATPTLSFKLGAGILPGLNVPVTLKGPTDLLNAGDVLVLDQGAPDLAEACVVATVTGQFGNGGITLQKVINAHADGATANSGLLIEEQKYMPADRPITRLSRTPLMKVASGVGRYAYGRRGDAANYNMEQFNLLAALSKFGGPPVWELFQPLAYSWDMNTGQLWAPAGVMLAYYSEIKVRYVSGFAQASIPPTIKMAVASVIKAMQSMPAAGDIKSIKAGDTSITKFASSLLDDDTKRALMPFAARAFS